MYKTRIIRCRFLLTALGACWLLGAHTRPVLAVEDIIWWQRPEDAEQAARQSGKPIYYFIFYARQTATMRMRFETFKNPRVIELLQGFECCAVDGAVAANRAMVDKYGQGVIKDPIHGIKSGRMPANLFRDAQANDQYICWGYVESGAFALMLLNVQRLIQLKAAVAADARDARAHVDLARVMMDLELQTNPVALTKIKQHLDAAIAADPDNKLGAKEDAILWSRVLLVPDDPQSGYELLSSFLKDFPNTRHKPTVTFYQATALYFQGLALDDKKDEKGAKAKWRQAFELLQPFKVKQGDTGPWATCEFALQALALEKELGIVLGVYRE